MLHDHGHHHGHSHAPAAGRRDTAFAVGVSLNSLLVTAQITVGLMAGSMALLADAVHNLGDVLGLLLSWGANAMGRRPPSARHTYGLGGSSILASLANAMLLLISIGAIGVEAVRHLLAPTPVDAVMVAWVAAAGLVVNGVSAALFMRGRAADLNLRTAFAHLASDAALSAGVLATALIIRRTGLMWLDPAVSLVIVGVIGVGTWSLLYEGANLALDAVPAHLDQARIAGFLAALPGVVEVHDLHVWALSTTECAVTAHLVQACADEGPAMVCAAVEGLREHFGIGHATIQIETCDTAVDCAQRADDVV
jgi:cobalt-zinc-cadmium efflux system protein